MREATIHKQLGSSRVEPNLLDLDAGRRSFSWASERAALEGLPGGGLNIAHECVVRHAAEQRRRAGGHPLAGAPGRSAGDLLPGARRDDEPLRERAVVARRGTEASGSFALTGRVPELYTAVLGTLKHRCVACTLFSAFGPEPIRQRLALGGAKVLVTTEALYRRKVAGRSGTACPDLRHVLLTDDDGRPPGTDSTFASSWTPRRRPTRSGPPIRRTWRCSTSRAARPARRRAPSTSTRPSSRTARRPAGRSTSMTTTCSGAPPIPAG